MKHTVRFPIRVNPEFAHIQLGSIPAPQPRQYYRRGLWYFTSTASRYF